MFIYMPIYNQRCFAIEITGWSLYGCIILYSTTKYRFWDWTFHGRTLTLTTTLTHTPRTENISAVQRGNVWRGVIFNSLQCSSVEQPIELYTAQVRQLILILNCVVLDCWAYVPINSIYISNMDERIIYALGFGEG